jgi:stage V sporulation protein SpoVS
MTIQAKTEAPTIFVSGKTPVDHLVAQVKEIADRRLSSGRDAQVGLRAIGAGAVSQAFAACARLAEGGHRDGLCVGWLPSFVSVEVAGETRTGILLLLDFQRGTRPEAADGIPAYPVAGTSIPGEIAGKVALPQHGRG